MIRKALQKIGLTEGETQVYEALIELGVSSTGAITKKANVASSKVYEVLQRLQNKGLVSYVMKNGVRHYDATPPERLIDFLEEKKEELSRSQEIIERVIPEINAKRELKENNQTVVYTGKKGPVIALREVLDEALKGNEVVGFGTDEDDYLKFFPAQLKNYTETAKKHKIKERLLFGKGFKSPNINANKRFLSKEFVLPVRTMIYGEKVAIVDFTEPMTTIIIEKSVIAKAYKQYFDLLWKIAKP